MPRPRLIASRKTQAAFAWVVSVFLFSLFYWLAWVKGPDSFILNKEFNLTPYEQLMSKLWTQDKGSMWGVTTASAPTTTTELDEFTKSIEEIDREAISAQAQIGALRAEQSRLELAEKAVYAEHSAKLWANVDHYKTTAVKSQAADVEAAAGVAAALMKAAEDSGSPVAALAAANANVKLASAEYALAVRQAEAADYVIHHLRELSDPSTTAQLNASNAKLSEIHQKQLQLTSHLSNIRSRAFSKLDEWYSKRTHRLEWIDFLYFSTGVSTTTTFGDIVPNSRPVRVIVLLQLIFSVLMVGYFVSLLTTPTSSAL